MFEASKVRRAEGICFSNHGDEIDTRTQAFHDFDIQGLQGMAGGSDKVQTSMDSKIDLVHPTGLLLLQHVGFMLVV